MHATPISVSRPLKSLIACYTLAGAGSGSGVVFYGSLCLMAHWHWPLILRGTFGLFFLAYLAVLGLFAVCMEWTKPSTYTLPEMLKGCLEYALIGAAVPVILPVLLVWHGIQQMEVLQARDREPMHPYPSWFKPEFEAAYAPVCDLPLLCPDETLPRAA